jgi:thioredoxin-dependent peroxiredoxin
MGGNIMTVSMQGKKLTLVGRKIKVGQLAPDFKVTNNKLETITLANFANKIKVITSFVSTDTPVCDLQVKEFNKEATTSADIVVLGISKDLPFAQQKFCAANNIKNVQLLSDYKSSSFGINYGLLIKENNLLARSIIILDRNNIIRYIQIVEEITKEPNYADALQNLNNIIKSPTITKTERSPIKCVACEAGTPPLAKAKITQLLPEISDWQLIEERKLVKEFKFSDFIEAKYFLDILAIIAEEQGHHPSFSLIYNKLKVTLTTHAADGLTDNDFIMAKIIDDISIT